MADTTTTNYNFTKPEIGASEDTWGTKLNANWDAVDGRLGGVNQISPDLTSFKIDGTSITVSGAEVNFLDGVTNPLQTQLDGKVDQTSSTGSAELPVGTTAQRDGTPSAGYLRFNTTDGAFEGYNGTEWAGIGGGGIAYTTQTANYTATEGEGIIADTSGGSFTVTLPSSPAEGDVVVVADGDDWSTNNLTVARNGSTIEGAAEDLTLDVGAILVSFIYDGATWQIYTQAGSYTATSSIEGFYPATVSGASQSLDLGTYNFFNAGTLTSDVTVSFSNVPTEARWSYSFVGGLASFYDIENASYDSVSLDVSGQESAATGFFFKDDGTKMYVVGISSDSVYQYSLSTAWDLSTASYDSVSFSVAGQDSLPFDLFFKDDGTKMYVLGFTTKAIYQYSLSTAWNVGTASYDTVFLYLIGDAFSPSSLSFKSDGAQMYVLAGADTIYQYTTATGISLTLPASVQNSPSERFTTERVTYEFYTLDGGTNVYLISEDIQ